MGSHRDPMADVSSAVAQLPPSGTRGCLDASSRLDYPDVAAALDVPVGTVASRLTGARAAVRSGIATDRPAVLDDVVA